jgi:hypothetical protein
LALTVKLMAPLGTVVKGEPFFGSAAEKSIDDVGAL